MSTHTAGPWHDSKRYGGAVTRIYGSNGGLIATMAALYSPPDKMKAANARLVAAAPELLEACKAALNVLDGTYEGDPTLFIHNAVAKATGGEEP